MTRITKAQVKMVKSLQMKKYRDELGYFVAEGVKCVEELRKGFKMVLLATPDNTSADDLARMSGLKTPSNYVAVFKRPSEGLKGHPEGAERTTAFERAKTADGDGIIVALDGVQDPGNIGTIIRTCDWFGVHDIVCSHDTADCYNPKVVQATMGALTRVRVHYTDLTQWLTTIRQEHPTLPIYGTLLEGTNMYEAGEMREGIIVMGNEGKGLSPAVREIVTHAIRIPSYPEGTETSESLNVSIAAAIVLAHCRR